MATVSAISYFKRYKMEVALAGLPLAPSLPAGFTCLPWSWTLEQAHATALYGSFHGEVDSHVFPSLGSPDGCCILMDAIVTRRSFVPEATWLLMGPDGPSGTIQALRDRCVFGSIQNVGVVPQYRGRGFGRILLLHALHGFYRSGLGRAMLEVTAQNEAAIRLYRRLGFRYSRTLYKAVTRAPAG
jgi:ribosomal protein S18 acetylase RimI-like enzyme